MAAVGGKRRRRAGRQRVGSGLGLRQRERANQLAVRQSRQVFLALRGVAEVDDRQRADAGVRAERAGERRIETQLLADARGADLVEAEAAVGFRDLEAREITVGGFPDQLTGQDPVLVVQLGDTRQDFRPHEFLGGAPKQQLFFGEIFASERGRGRRVGNEKTAVAAARPGIEL